MGNDDELIRELSGLCGILPEYWDVFGNKHTISADTARALLRAMKLKIDSADDISKEIGRRRSGSWKTFLEPVHVLSVNEKPFSIPLYIPAKEGDETKLTVSWSLENERGKKDEFGISGDAVHVSEQRWIDGTRHIKINLTDTKRRDIGYYTLRVSCKCAAGIFPDGEDVLSKKSKIIITPDACFLPEELRNGRAWGFSVNLYSIRSKRNWGIGDFRDLEKIVRWTAGLNASFVGINPLHAISNTIPFGISPYSPISRLYRNFIYLDMENIPEVKHLRTAARGWDAKRLNKELERLRKSEYVDYEKAASAKERVLRKAFALFCRTHLLRETIRGRAFRKYAESEGLCLESFALFMSLQEFMRKKKKAYSWQDWPKSFHRISGRAVRLFKKNNSKEILYYQYVQWLIDGQLRRIAEKTRKLGMTIGLYHDLAVGSLGGGSDAWSFQDVIASGAEVGAPPDDFSPDGQKWGFPPIIPERLRETGYELFIQTIRQNMKYGGALRIDHALGMFRLFWIPQGAAPNDGAYVSYASEDMLRIIALESARHRTMVIAEDLGTIGENVREALKKFSMLSYRVLYFERNYPDPSFLAPERYPIMALCSVTTHDLPTIYGYWEGRDIEARRRTGKYPGDALWNRQIEERARDKRLIVSALRSCGVIPADRPSEALTTAGMTPELCRAVYHYLALTPCKLLLVSLNDIAGTLDQQNMPGTVDSYPNWVQKTSPSIEEIVNDRRFTDLSRVLNKYFD